MAGFTWDNEQADREADDELNYVEDSGIPGDGDTLTLDGTEGAGWEDGWPNANLPAAGTISYVFSGDETVAEQYAEGEIDTLHDGADFGTILVNLDTGMYHPGASGKVTMTLGTLYNVQDADVELDGGEIAYDSDVFTFTGTLTSTANGGAITLDGTTELTCSQTLTLEDSVDLNLGYDTGSPNSPILTADLVLNAGSTLYVNHNGSGTPEIQGDLTLSGGTIDWNGVELTVDGDLTFASDSTCSNKGNTVLTGTHDITWNNENDRLGTVELASGAAYTRTAVAFCEGITIPADASMDGNHNLTITRATSGNDYMTVPSGRMTEGGIYIRAYATASNAPNVYAPSLLLRTNTAAPLTISGILAVDDLEIYGLSAGQTSKLILSGGGGSNSLGAVALGHEYANCAGQIDFADQTHAVESIVGLDNGGGALKNVVDFGTGTVNVSGGSNAIDGTYLVFDNTSGTIIGDGSTTLSNCDTWVGAPGALITAIGCVDGGSNDCINFFAGGGAGSMLLTGAGG